MLYVHSFSAIEQELFQFIKYADKNVTQLSVGQSLDLDNLELQMCVSTTKHSCIHF